MSKFNFKTDNDFRDVKEETEKFYMVILIMIKLKNTAVKRYFLEVPGYSLDSRDRA